MCARLDRRVVQICLPSLVRSIRPARDARALFELVTRLRDLEPDIVHTHTSKAGIIGRCAAYLAQVDAIVHGVHILPFVNVGRAERAVYLTLERLLDPLTDAFVDVSGEMRDVCLREHVGGPAAHIVVPSGMDITRFRKAPPISPAEARCAFGLNDHANVQLVVMVAALEPRKRVVEFLPVFKEVTECCPNARLAILGEGVERLRALDRIEALGLEEHVALLGYRDDVERWIAGADVCVLASEREGLPRVVVQYALAARPCVVTALPGVETVVRDGGNGYVTADDDLHEMAAPITRLLQRPQLRAEFSAFARSLNLADWSDASMIDALERVYRRVLEETRQEPFGDSAWIS
jgi:glycosyltransferase involved in cell wall biosynthesis